MCDHNYSSFCCANTPCQDSNNETCQPHQTGFVTFSQAAVPFTTIGVIASASTSVISSASNQITRAISNKDTSTTTARTSRSTPSSSGSRAVPLSNSIQTVTVGSKATSASSSVSSPSPTGDSSQSNHSDTSKVGIGVGVSVGVAISAMSLVFYLRRRHRKQDRDRSKDLRPPFTPNSHAKDQTPFADRSGMGYPPVELSDGVIRSRMAEMQRPLEKSDVHFDTRWRRIRMRDPS